MIDDICVVGEGEGSEEITEVSCGFKLNGQGSEIRNAKGIGVGDFGLDGEQVAEDGGIRNGFGVFITVFYNSRIGGRAVGPECDERGVGVGVDAVGKFDESVNLGRNGGGRVEDNATPNVAGFKSGQIDSRNDAKIVGAAFENLP